MQGRHAAEVADFPTPFLETEAQRQILMVHEHFVGHPAHIQYRLAADHDEGTHERLYVAIALVVPIPHHLVREHATVGEEYMEVESLPNEIQKSIVSSGGFDLDSSVRKQNSAPDGAKGGIRVQLSDAGLQRAVADLRVGIEKEDVAAAGLDQSQVVRPRETQVLMILNDPHEREALCNRLEGPIGRAVVHQDHLDLELALALEYTLDAREHKLPDVPGHEDHRKVGAHRAHRATRGLKGLKGLKERSSRSIDGR